MSKFRIVWDAGYGQSEDIVECDTQAEAEDAAYQAWLDEAESQGEYWAEPLCDKPDMRKGVRHE